jgi:hypothetical protein
MNLRNNLKQWVRSVVFAQASECPIPQVTSPARGKGARSAGWGSHEVPAYDDEVRILAASTAIQIVSSTACRCVNSSMSQKRSTRNPCF